jgi:Domain of unknown function (DUF1963)
MTGPQLRALLLARRLDRLVAPLLALASPTVRIYIERVDERDLPMGSSKLGGRPDLPTGVDWPAWHEPMAFIGQFDLRELAPHDREGALPTSGLLAFFYETNGEPLYAAGWGQPAGSQPSDWPPIDARLSWRVLHLPVERRVLHRHEIPDGLNPEARFPACAARFAPEVTLPDPDGPELRPLHMTISERNELIDLLEDVNRGSFEEGGHHLLGHPYELPSSTLATAMVSSKAARGLPNRWSTASPEQQRALEDEAQRSWRLLLQVDSSEQARMDWAGGGVLHWCIPREALAAGDFGQVWLNMQFL